MRLAGLTNRSRSRAAAILLALWALFVLSAMVISWALDINAQLTISSSANRLLEATAMACSGAEVAMHPSVKPSSPLLRRSLAPNQSYETHMSGEGGRLNLNAILTVAMGDPNSPYLELLRRYLEVKGVELNDRDHMIDCLLDWVDADNLVRLAGAEDEPGYKPSNTLLKSLDEIKRVRGWDEFTSRPDWDEDFTLAQGVGPSIDINWASRDVLLSLPGMTENLADRFLQIRRGPDNVEGTEDDVLFTNGGPGGDVQIALGLRGDQFNQLAGLITVIDPVMRVVSVGKSANVTRTVRLVVFKRDNAIRLLPGTWKEF
jgi:hypothetical protein